MPIVINIPNARFIVKPFSSSQMREIAQALVDSIIARIKRGENVRDAAAKSLTSVYAARKAKIGAIPLRNLLRTGKTLGSAKVLNASENRAVIGFANDLAGAIALSQNKVEKMWGVSPSDRRAMNAVVLRILQQPDLIQLEPF